jgi:hypothetical protein
MNIDAINRHLCPSQPLDWFAPGAAMKLAWFWTAQELWRERDFTTDGRAVCAAKLKAAWDHVKRHQNYTRRNEAAANDIRVRALMIEREQLQNKSFGVSIADEQRRIDARIDAIVDTL